MLNNPRILGPVEIPTTVRGHDLIGKQVAVELPELKDGWALAIEFADAEELRVGRKQISMACTRLYGAGRIETGSNAEILYVWLKPEELEIAALVKEHLFGKKAEVSHA